MAILITSSPTKIVSTIAPEKQNKNIKTEFGSRINGSLNDVDL